MTRVLASRPGLSCSNTRSAPGSSRRTGTTSSGSLRPCATSERPRRCCSADSKPVAGATRSPKPYRYGRLVKTNFILAWLADEELRGRIGRQLNKGEQLHALRRAIFYVNEGHVRQRTPDQQSEQALCLSIVVNAIIAWNTV